MENASKALIIAGAILIAILLISVGIMVMNSMNKPIDAAAEEADSQAVQMYNAKFTNYAGKTATEVKNLLMAIQASNAADKNHYIDVNHKYKSEGTETYSSTKVKNGNNYNKSIGDLLSEITNDKNYTIEVHFADKEYPSSGANKGKYGNKDYTEMFGITEKGYVALVRILDPETT